MKRIIILTLILTFISACAPTNATRGNFLFAEDVNLIKPAMSTQTDVLNILGTPTSKAVFDENVWYYVGLKTEKKSFFDEKVTERLIYKVAFDDTGIVQSVEQIQEDAEQVPIASRVTPTSGNEVTFLQQVLGNIGKFNPPVEK